jgi:hypothetical protein
LFAAHGDFGPVLDWQAEPEARLRLDEFAGEPRNSDLVVKARDQHGSYLIAVEAKADESFGDTLIGTVASAIERYVENNRSMGVTRALQLASTLFGPKRQGDQKLRGMRYQLLTACAGALCEAERLGFSRAVMLVHEFITDRTVDEKHWKNAADLNNFVKRLSHGEVGELCSGEMCGPFVVPGKPLVSRPISLYLGKVTRNIRSE